MSNGIVGETDVFGRICFLEKKVSSQVSVSDLLGKANSSDLSSHVNDSEAHITSMDRIKWNNKIDIPSDNIAENSVLYKTSSGISWGAVEVPGTPDISGGAIELLREVPDSFTASDIGRVFQYCGGNGAVYKYGNIYRVVKSFESNSSLGVNGVIKAELFNPGEKEIREELDKKANIIHRHNIDSIDNLSSSLSEKAAKSDISDAEITIIQGGTEKGKFTLNQVNSAVVVLETGGGSGDVTKEYVDEQLSKKITMPDGGKTGQFLMKTDSGVKWADCSGGGGGASEFAPVMLFALDNPVGGGAPGEGLTILKRPKFTAVSSIKFEKEIKIEEIKNPIEG